MKGHQKQSAQEAGRWTTGLLKALEPKGQALWQETWKEFLGSQLGTRESPGLLSAHLSSPTPRPGSPLSPRAPAWNPGLAAASAPTLSSAQLPCVVSEAAHEAPRTLQSLPLSLALSHPALGSCSHLCQEAPAQLSPLCIHNSNNNSSNNNQRSCGMSRRHGSFWFPHFTDE